MMLPVRDEHPATRTEHNIQLVLSKPGLYAHVLDKAAIDTEQRQPLGVVVADQHLLSVG